MYIYTLSQTSRIIVVIRCHGNFQSSFSEECVYVGCNTPCHVRVQWKCIAVQNVSCTCMQYNSARAKTLFRLQIMFSAFGANCVNPISHNVHVHVSVVHVPIQNLYYHNSIVAYRPTYNKGTCKPLIFMDRIL